MIYLSTAPLLIIQLVKPLSTTPAARPKPISAQGCGGVTSITASSGRVHNTILINGQCWLQTNLITTPSVYSAYTAASWTNTSPGDQGYSGYFNTTTTLGTAGWQATEPTSFVAGGQEGLLYQWCGAMNATISERSRGICPEGFHVPSDCEWMFLEHGQGMSITNQNANALYRGNAATQGTSSNKLRSQGTGSTNLSGFSVLLAGFRSTNGTFGNRPANSYFLTSSGSVGSVIGRLLSSANSGVYRNTGYTRPFAFSVRCLKD